MKPFIVLDGVTYINEAILTKGDFSKVYYSGGTNRETTIHLGLVGQDFSLQVKDGKLSIIDRNGVERITGKFYD